MKGFRLVKDSRMSKPGKARRQGKSVAMSRMQQVREKPFRAVRELD